MGFKCPYCHSEEIEVVENTGVYWGNNDQGTTLETLQCLDCGKSFTAKARVEVIHREYDIQYCCPYCSESNDVELDSEDPKQQINWFLCRDCNKNFAIHTEKWYSERLGIPE